MTSTGAHGAFLGAAKRWLTLRAAVPFSALLGSRAGGRVGVLMYHRVSELYRGASAPTWNVTPERFREQLRGLLDLGFRALPLREVIDRGRNGGPLPSRTFVVTFDDGYENVYRNAWPVLRELGVPATVFLATAYLDGARPFPFDDWHSAGSERIPAHSWRPLTTAQCCEMIASGLIELGAHTHTHADFRGRAGDFERDLARCVAFMAERFGLSGVTFAFPYGVRSAGFCAPELVAAARRTVLCSLTTEPELVNPTGDPYTWGRFNVEQADSGAAIAAFLDGWYSLARDAWRSLRREETQRRVTAC